MDLVSVILPVYNVEKYVENSLRSVIGQTYPDIECLIIDDCGTDRSMDVVENVLAHSNLAGKKIRILRHEKNRGLSAARNTGLDYAEGTYIFFLDSDDSIRPNCIEKHVEAISKDNADFSIGNTHLVAGKSVHIHAIKQEISLEKPLLSFLKHEWDVSAWNKLYRAEFLRKSSLTFTEGLIFEDILWSFCLSIVSKKICVVEDAFYDYFIRENSITKKKNNSNKINSMIYIVRTMSKLSQSFSDEESALLMKYSGRLKFNTSLLLLNFEGTRDECKAFYSEIKTLPGKGLFNNILCLPFALFNAIFKPLYSLYKLIALALG